jgi:hypothetical protein
MDVTSWLSPYRWLLTGGLIAALVLGYFAWADHVGDRREATVRAEYTAAALVASEAARAKETAWQTQLTKAQNEATQRQKTLAADAAAARHSADSLRDDLATVRASLPGLTREAVDRYADTASIVFADCIKEYSDLAKSADRHAGDQQTLNDGWPSN